jgi:exosortase B
MIATTLSALRQNTAIKVWWPVLFGLLALYLPTYWSLAEKSWPEEDNAHGPIILAIVLWVVWRSRNYLSDTSNKKNPVIGGIFVIIGLLLYVVGRSQEILLFEAGSQIPLLLGVLLSVQGVKIVPKFWYALVFLVFLIPLPGFVIEMLTGPLKNQVSVLAENILYWVGYPIARNGVVLSIGPYQLLVADACSGLNSMFSLSALGLFYTYLVQRAGWAHNTILLSSIIPIAFFANVIRVMLLVLITYYFGDEVGQGFAHKASGMALFMVALTSFLVLDSMIGRLLKWSRLSRKNG